jgi:RND family efflux transporter MFP subunit
MKPSRRDITQTLTLPANISPWYQATLYAKTPGYLKWIGSDKGDTVKKGQLLAEIDSPEVEQQFRQAEADYRIKQITFQRLMNVWKENPEVIAKQDVDVAEAAANGAKHVMENRRTLLAYTKVYAPFTGVITARFADPGALIQSAATTAMQAVPLFTIMDLDTLRVYVSVPQEAAMQAKPGVPAIITTRELPGQELRATITRTTNALDPATRSLLVEIDLPNPGHRLQPGMFVTTTLVLQEHAQVLALPPAALVTSPNGKSVFIVEEGLAKRVPVKTGLDDGVWIEITEGLQEGMDVVVVGKSGLTDGQPVQSSPSTLPVGKPSSQKL